MQGTCAGTGGISLSAALRFLSSPFPSRISIRVSNIFFPYGKQISSHNILHLFTVLPASSPPSAVTMSGYRKSAIRATGSLSSVGSEQYAEEPATKVKFSTSATLPGCSSPLSLLGTGHRERVFAIIGVKVYAAGFYVNPSLIAELDPWKGKSRSDIMGDGSLFSSIFQASLEKSLQIVLVRDIDGKTFWDALDEAITPRIKTLTLTDESALSTFRSIFQGRPLKKGTIILLTWLGKSKMLVSVSSDGLPSGVDAEIVSENVTSALFNVFLGDSPVSPSLKASVLDGLVKILN